jgi:hypothetical protein
LPDEVSRTTLPNQLVIPGIDDFTRPSMALDTVSEAYDTVSEASDTPVLGQTTLFVMPPVVLASSSHRDPSPTETGEAGQSLFRAACSARGLGYMEPPDPAHKGFDCFVEGHRIQVKATAKLGSDGRFRFSAGSSGSFKRYRDTCDLFAFVIVASDSDLYGRMKLLEAGVVINRWPGSQVALRPSDFPQRPELTLLLPRVTDQVINELLRI